MSESKKHTEGRLHTCEQFKRGIVDAKGRLVASMDYAYLECDADRERMIAVWNACEGVKTETLIAYAGDIEFELDTLQTKLTSTTNLLEIAIEERDKARSVKDTLLESLKTILDPECMEDIRLLIKKAEGGE